MPVSVARQHLVRRVRDAGFTFDRVGERVEIYRQRGGPQRVNIPRRDWVTEKHARAILVQAGLTEAEIEDFFHHAETNCRN